MGIIELFLIAIGLSMDAFAVSITEGLCINDNLKKKAIITGIFFGLFQAIMPTIGYFLGSSFAHLIDSYDHWIAFILLIIIGGKMVYESFDKKKDDLECDVNIDYKKLFTLSIATSIDALAVGLSFAFLKVDLIPAITTIGIITLILSIIGINIGYKLGSKYKNKAELFGGIILILIGLKILLEHLNIL